MVELHQLVSTLQTIRSFRPLPFLVLGAAILCTACRPVQEAGPGWKQNPEVLARVGNQLITRQTLQTELDRGIDPSVTLRASIDPRHTALEALIDQEAVYAQALAAGFAQTPEMRRKIRLMVVSHFREQQCAITNVAVDPQEIEANYQANPHSYTIPAAVQAAAIYIAVPRKASLQRLAEVQTLAAQVLEQARQVSDESGFAALAVRHSDHQASRYRGGDLGWLALPTHSAPLTAEEEIALALSKLSQPGEVAPLIHTGGGFYIAKLRQRRPAGVRPLSEVGEEIRRQLYRAKCLQAERNFYSRMRTGLDIETLPDRLNSLSVPQRPPELPGVSLTQR